MENLESQSIEQISNELLQDCENVKTVTPVTLGGGVIEGLCEIYDMWNKSQSFGKDFFGFFFEPLWDEEGASGERQFEEIKKAEDMEDFNGEALVIGFKEAAISLALMSCSCAYVVQCFKAEEGSPEAWEYAFEANRILGILQGFISGRYYGSIEGKAKTGESGGIARGDKYKPLSELAKSLVSGREYASTRNAAIKIEANILDAARKENIPLSKTQAVTTISGWIKNHVVIKK
jgi:hypothetical protein